MQLRDGEHEHDARRRASSSVSPPPSRRTTRASGLPLVRRPVSSKNDQNNARPTSAGTINQPERRSRRRYARRDATNAPAWPRSTRSSIPASQALVRFVAPRARARSRARGAARAGGRWDRADPRTRPTGSSRWPGSTCTRRRADTGVDLEHARRARLRRRSRRPRRSRAWSCASAPSRVPGSTIERGGRRPATNAAQRGREPRVREQRGLDVGAVAEIEHVAGEHDDARAAALLDRRGHRSAHLAGDVGRGVGEPEIAEHQHPGAPLDRRPTARRGRPAAARPARRAARRVRPARSGSSGRVVIVCDRNPVCRVAARTVGRGSTARPDVAGHRHSSPGTGPPEEFPDGRTLPADDLDPARRRRPGDRATPAPGARAGGLRRRARHAR